jgi:DNA-binding CsgD family transcriptional regulator
MAGKLDITKRAVDALRERLFEKLGVQSRTALALYAINIGLQPADDRPDDDRK